MTSTRDLLSQALSPLIKAAPAIVVTVGSIGILKLYNSWNHVEIKKVIQHLRKNPTEAFSAQSECKINDKIETIWTSATINRKWETVRSEGLQCLYWGAQCSLAYLSFSKLSESILLPYTEVKGIRVAKIAKVIVFTPLVLQCLKSLSMAIAPSKIQNKLDSLSDTLPQLAPAVLATAANISLFWIQSFSIGFTFLSISPKIWSAAEKDIRLQNKPKDAVTCLHEWSKFFQEDAELSTVMSEVDCHSLLNPKSISDEALSALYERAKGKVLEESEESAVPPLPFSRLLNKQTLMDHINAILNSSKDSTKEEYSSDEETSALNPVEIETQFLETIQNAKDFHEKIHKAVVEFCFRVEKRHLLIQEPITDELRALSKLCYKILTIPTEEEEEKEPITVHLFSGLIEGKELLPKGDFDLEQQISHLRSQIEIRSLLHPDSFGDKNLIAINRQIKSLSKNYGLDLGNTTLPPLWKRKVLQIFKKHKFSLEQIQFNPPSEDLINKLKEFIEKVELQTKKLITKESLEFYHGKPTYLPHLDALYKLLQPVFNAVEEPLCPFTLQLTEENIRQFFKENGCTVTKAKKEKTREEGEEEEDYLVEINEESSENLQTILDALTNKQEALEESPFAPSEEDLASMKQLIGAVQTKKDSSFH